MSITIKKNIQPKLTTCKMNCDDGLHPKLEMYELTKFLNTHTVSVMQGMPGSGKSSLIFSLFFSKKLLKKTYNSIFVFQPSSSMASMKDNIFNELPKEQLYDELTYDNLNEVLNIIKIATPEEKHCIIIDDMTVYLKNKDTLKQLKEMIFNRRHLHLSIFILVQTWKSIPREIRLLINNVFIFKCSKNTLEDIFEEIVEQKKELITAISKTVFDKKFNFLFLNVESQRMFKNWDEIVLNQDTDV